MQKYALSLALFLLSLLLIREISLLPDGKLHLHVLDVGQGDSIFVVTPSGKQILVDGGPDMRTLEHLQKHMSFFDRTIDLVLMTHPDLDHRAALPAIFERYTVRHFLTAQNANPHHDIVMGDGVVLDVVEMAHCAVCTKSRNNQSVVIRVLYEDDSILLTGDIEEEAERAILASGADVRANVLKVAHHGSRTSSSTGFLLAVSPKEALISSGRGNRFGHPHTEILERLRSFHIQTETTADKGVISRSF